MAFLDRLFQSKLLAHPRIRYYAALINEDLTATYSRDIQKWLLVAPIIGVITGLFITAIATLILDTIWVRVLPYYLMHHWAIVVGLLIWFLRGMPPPVMMHIPRRRRGAAAEFQLHCPSPGLKNEE